MQIEPLSLESLSPVLIGGALIGLSSGLWYLLSGRIAGISGLIHQMVRGQNLLTSLAFIFGLILAGTLSPYVVTLWHLNQNHDLHVTLPRLILSGLIVGIGTKWANGCTSGHGVSGLARLSLRSFVAVPLFIGAAIVTVWFFPQFGVG